MCIISGAVNSVKSTKILCIPSQNKKRQLTVYSNAVSTNNTNAMCLPVPNPQTVRFEKVPKNIFTQCRNSFLLARSFGGQAAAAGTLKVMKSKEYLAIQSHGSYDVVLVPSMSNIERIPPSFLILTEEVKEFLHASYPENFGIVLCKLKAGSTEYEPFAYSHVLQENLQLFFPTKHFHLNSEDSTITHTLYDDEPESHNQFDFEPNWLQSFEGSLLGGSVGLNKTQNTRFADDWDHEIYSIGTPTWCHESKKKIMNTANFIGWNEMPAEFQLDASAILRCREVVGHNQNIDIIMPISVA